MRDKVSYAYEGPADKLPPTPLWALGSFPDGPWVGYYDDPSQDSPVFDPGLEVNCPVCLKALVEPVKTISLWGDPPEYSLFYRTHKQCWEALSPAQQSEHDASAMLSFQATRGGVL